RNCMVVEHDDRLLLIDCGLMFPDADMHGIDLVLPDFTWLRENAHRIEACVATHGHEDHVGGLQFLLRELSFPIYGSQVTLGLARHRIEEAGLLGKTELIPVVDNERRYIGPFDVEFIPVTHSVPHAHAIALHTPQGVIVHSGDFKIDLTPVDDRRTDLARLGALAAGDGIRLLMLDSTNAEERGSAPSERSVGVVLRQLFTEHRHQRIITASFASHIHRVQQIAEAAVDAGRVVATLGRSMINNVRMARDLGLIRLPDKSFVDIEDIDDYPPEKVCVISTGSQGEPMAALSLLARGDSKFVKVGPQDTVIFSSHAIPGNESNVNRVIDGLLRAGANVVHSGIADVHATGHAQAEDLKMYLSITDDGIERTERVPAGMLYVDGIVGDVGQGVLRDRRVLAEEGVVVVVVTVDVGAAKVLVGPEIITRGWVYAPEAEDLIEEGCEAVATAVERALKNGTRDVDALEKEVRRAAGKFVSERTKRRPMIVPVVMET
ncbi:MAG: ribonuclease J, partial [Actinobacteria bacterium]|nr:ribonuclease J [Actinomycetota bacterium]